MERMIVSFQVRDFLFHVCTNVGPMVEAIKRNEEYTASLRQHTGYSIVTGDDNKKNGCNGRNPKSWELYGCNDANANSEAGRNSENWVLIDRVTDDTVLQDENYTKYDYYNLASPSTEKYRYFKLEIKETKDSNVMQMSEFILNYSACVHNWEKRKPLLRRPVLSAMQSKK